MLGPRDRNALFSTSAPASGFMGPPTSAPPALFAPPPEVGAFAGFGIKSDPLGVPDDVLHTRRASYVASQSEPEHEQQLAVKGEQDVTKPEPQEPEEPKTHVIRKRNVGVPKFLRFLFQILEVEDPSIISWSHQGTAFQIRQPEELADKILPRYFKHNKVSSFQRQLNYFGFKKWTKTQTNICTFSHPFFLQADKDMMKLIKRKERVNTTGLTTITIVAPSDAHFQARAQFKAEAEAFAQLQSQLPAQQALKRQKSNTMAPMISGQTAAFLSSAMAGRRHSTGMLPGSEHFGFAAAAAAAASAAENRKRMGNPTELELDLELEARTDSLANATTPQQQFLHLQKLAEARNMALNRPPQSAHGKRKSLPQVLPPDFGDSLGAGMVVNLGNSFNPGPVGMNLGRRRSDQFLPDFASHGNPGNPVNRPPMMHFLSSSSSSSSQQVIFTTSSGRNEASPVLSISSNPLSRYQREVQQQRQQQQRQQMYGGAPRYGSVEIKSEPSSVWPTSINVSPPSSVTNLTFPPPTQHGNQMMPMPLFKCVESNSSQNSMPTFENGAAIPRPGSSQPHYQPQQQTQSYHHHQSNQQPPEPKDYIDVLLESAALDENLSEQNSSTVPSASWDTSYTPTPTQNPLPASEPAGPYPFAPQQQQAHQQLQLSPMGGLPHHPGHRF